MTETRMIERAYDPSESRWVVCYLPGYGLPPYRACAPHGNLNHYKRTHSLHEALNYARSQTPQETP
jgi:hypothetical protein